MQQRASIRFRVVFFVLTAAMLAFAFIHSAMPAQVSAEESGGVLDFLYSLLPRLGISMELTDHIVRKLAHFTEFTVIGMLATTCAYSFDRLQPIPSAFYSQVLPLRLPTRRSSSFQRGAQDRSPTYCLIFRA